MKDTNTLAVVSSAVFFALGVQYFIQGVYFGGVMQLLISVMVMVMGWRKK